MNIKKHVKGFKKTIKEFDEFDRRFMKQIEELNNMKEKVSDESRKVIDNILKRKWNEHEKRVEAI